MANPQPDKFTRISNELMEAVPKFRFNGTQLRLLLVIWRYTYGFRRKEYEFPLSFLADAIAASKSQVDRELSSLIENRVLEVVSGGFGVTRTLLFNKNYEEWSIPRRVQRPRSQGGAGTEMGIYKDVIDYLNKKTGKRYSSQSVANRKLISGRVSEGRTLEDFLRVIDVKCSHWLDDPKMSEYLRPSTLFRPMNFENYLNQEPRTDQAEQPKDIRDKDIAFQQYMQDGGEPDEFDWS